MKWEAKRSQALLLLLLSALLASSCSQAKDGSDNISATGDRDDVPSATKPTPTRELEKADHTQEAQALDATSKAPTLNERNLAKTLAGAMACRRAETMRKVVASNPMADPQIRANLIEADKLCAETPNGKSADVENLALTAARQGNSAAAACFVSGALKNRSQSAQARARSDELYANEAPKLIEAAVAAGSWQMVANAAAINGQRSIHSPFVLLPPPDPVKGYMYAKLLELGASGEEKLDLKLVALERANAIDNASRMEADRLANELYRDHFRQSGAYTHQQSQLCAEF